jgi:iron-sulfur cluster assembly protein
MSSSTRPKRDLFQVTPEASRHLHDLMMNKDSSVMGIRVGVRARGCSGYSYTLELAYSSNPQDDIVKVGDLSIFIDPKAILYLVGTIMDFVEEDTQKGFKFINPNEKGRCGCGESFHV